MKTKDIVIVFLIIVMLGFVFYLFSFNSGKTSQVEALTLTVKKIPHLYLSDIESEQVEPAFPSELYRAMDDYKWRMDLIKEQQNRLDMLYSAKIGVKMDRVEYASSLEAMKSSIKEFVKRNLNAISSGYNYRNLINENIDSLNYDSAVREIERINDNTEIFRRDIDTALSDYNRIVDEYNKAFATDH